MKSNELLYVNFLDDISTMITSGDIKPSEDDKLYKLSDYVLGRLLNDNTRFYTYSSAKGMGMIPIVIKLLPITEDNQGIYVTDKYWASPNNAVGLVSGYLTLSDYVDISEGSPSTYIDSQLGYMFCTQNVINGEYDYINLSDSNKRDLVKILSMYGFEVIERYAPFYDYSDDVFNIYVPVVVKRIIMNEEKVVNVVNRTQESFTKKDYDLFHESKDNKQMMDNLRSVYDIAPKDIRNNTREIDLIFHTGQIII